MAKNKLKRASIRAKTAITTCMLATVCPAYCDINGNTAMQKFLKTMFSITVFAGIGLIVGGAVLCALKAIITAIIGTDPTTMTFY